MLLGILLLVASAASPIRSCGPLLPLRRAPQAAPLRSASNSGGASGKPGPADPNLKATLGGQAEFDGHIKNSPLGTEEPPIREARDLSCSDWLGCRWRNEPDGPGRDKLGWGRGRGEWDTVRGNIGFGTTQKAAGNWLITGSGVKENPANSAMLVSDPVPCQMSDGEISLRYWTTPGARVRTCVRRPNEGNNFIYCSPHVSDGDPGPAVYNIPGPIDHPFEIVIEASGFNYNQFGIKGGGCIIDDLRYLTRSVTDGCARNNEPRQRAPPTTGAPPPRRQEQVGENVGAVCDQMACDFNRGVCGHEVNRRSGWSRQASGPHGNRHTGVRRAKDGGYMVADGPRASVLNSGPFILQSDKIMKFCYYRPAALSNLVISANKQGSTREQLFKTPAFNLRQQHDWKCDQVLLAEGVYDNIEYQATGLAEYASLAVDDIQLYDLRNTPLC